MRMKPCLSAADARRIIDAAKAEAEKSSWKVTIAVVDEGGTLIALERMDGAFINSAEIAHGKAASAARFRRPSKALEDPVKERPGLVTMPGLRVQGGLPVMVDGECAGAVGVSGADSGQDEQCARVGIEALGG